MNELKTKRFDDDLYICRSDILLMLGVMKRKMDDVQDQALIDSAIEKVATARE